MNPQTTNPNDLKVVSFHNSTDFGFTPEMGCMYDGRPVNGKSGAPGIDAGETVMLPYHVGMQLALNLAKVAILKTAPSVDPAGIPTGVPLWDTRRLDGLKASYIKELYSEERAIAPSQTDILMAKVEELRKNYDILKEQIKPEVKDEPVNPDTTEDNITYQDKQEVIAELERRGIAHDKRSSKENLEKLLA